MDDYGDCDVAVNRGFMESLKEVLMRRDGMSSEVADEAIEEARNRVLDDEEDPEDVLREEFGLEPDYLFDLLG